MIREIPCPRCGMDVTRDDHHYLIECGVCKMCYDMWGDDAGRFQEDEDEAEGVSALHGLRHLSGMER